MKPFTANAKAAPTLLIDHQLSQCADCTDQVGVQRSTFKFREFARPTVPGGLIARRCTVRISDSMVDGRSRRQSTSNSANSEGARMGYDDHLASQGLMPGGNLCESQIVTNNDVLTYVPKRKHVRSPHPFCDPLCLKQGFSLQRRQLTRLIYILQN